MEEFKAFQKYVQVLHCPLRWTIISLLVHSPLSTHEILQGLQKKREHISRSGLYYHLSELQKGDIIELAAYREEGGGAPEKVWQLKRKEITINLTALSEVNHES
ncbi:MAG: helix-turn-helix domain-containing protein [Theionarchaea archaeon]|nr:helix-turn-helix domain-containing protein [Theionarchaea archaeon]